MGTMWGAPSLQHNRLPGAAGKLNSVLAAGTQEFYTERVFINATASLVIEKSAAAVKRRRWFA